MINPELERIREEIRIQKEDARKELISMSSCGECSPTSLRLSPELKSKAKKLAFKRYNKTEVSQLLQDLLIDALRKEGLL
jgi:hypothetical protein